MPQIMKRAPNELFPGKSLKRKESDLNQQILFQLTIAILDIHESKLRQI